MKRKRRYPAPPSMAYYVQGSILKKDLKAFLLRAIAEEEAIVNGFLLIEHNKKRQEQDAMRDRCTFLTKALTQPFISSSDEDKYHDEIDQILDKMRKYDPDDQYWQRQRALDAAELFVCHLDYAEARAAYKGEVNNLPFNSLN